MKNRAWKLYNKVLSLLPNSENSVASILAITFVIALTTVVSSIIVLSIIAKTIPNF